MLPVLSIQSDVIGNRVYCNSLRHYFAGFPDIALDAHWYNEGRSLASKLIHRAASTYVPFAGQNRDFRRARSEWGYGYVAGRLARKQLAERPYRLLHFHTQVQAFGAADLMRRIPTVISIDMTAFQIAREAPEKLRYTFRPGIAMERKAFARAAHIVTFSDWARRSVLEEHGLPEDRVTTIIPGTRLETFTPPRFEPSSTSPSRPRILFVGGDFTRKGGWDLLAVFAKHFTGRAELHLVTGQDLPALPPNAFQHKNITVYSPEWHALFHVADIFCMPSYAEAMGHVYQEAAGYGLALIGTRVGGVPEVVREGDNGFLVTPGDQEALAQSLDRLLGNAPLLAHQRRRSYELAQERFSAAANFRRMADLFHTVADQGN